MGGLLIINLRDHKDKEKWERTEIDYGIWKVHHRIILKKKYVLENRRSLQSVFPMWVEVHVL